MIRLLLRTVAFLLVGTTACCTLPARMCAAEFKPGARVTANQRVSLTQDGEVKRVAESGTELLVTKVDGNWVRVELDENDQTITGWIHARYLDLGGEQSDIRSRQLESHLEEIFKGHEYVAVKISSGDDVDSVAVAASGYTFDAWFTGRRPKASTQFTVPAGESWCAVSDFLVERVAHLWQAAQRTAPGRNAGKYTSLVFHFPEAHSVKISDSLTIDLTPETQKYLKVHRVSDYPALRRVLIVHEPHEDVDAQFALFKGLESLFAANATVVRDRSVVFLSEGTPAGDSVSVQPLVNAVPDPSDALIHAALGTYLIPGYVAYAWKSHQQNSIPILGTEDASLYRLCARWTSRLRAQKRRELVGYSHSVVARNQPIVRSLLEQIGRYECPVLFVGAGHLRPWPTSLELNETDWKALHGTIDRSEVEALKKADRRGIGDLLRERNIGYCLLTPYTRPIRNKAEQQRQWARYCGLLQAQSTGDVTSHLRELVPRVPSCSIRPAPKDLEAIRDELAQEFLKAVLKTFADAVEAVLQQQLEAQMEKLLDELYQKEQD